MKAPQLSKSESGMSKANPRLCPVGRGTPVEPSQELCSPSSASLSLSFLRYEISYMLPKSLLERYGCYGCCVYVVRTTEGIGPSIASQGLNIIRGS